LKTRLTVIVDAYNWDSINEAHFFCDVLLSAIDRPVEYRIIRSNEQMYLTDNVLILNPGNGLDDIVRVYL